jgi:hypothetical protein
MAMTKISQADWLRLVSESMTDRSVVSPFGNLMPGFPSEDLQRNTTSLSGDQALLQAHSFYTDICSVLDSSRNKIDPTWKILDFGSCWGRISRFFMRDVPLENLYGLDVEQSFVDECKQLFGSENFQVCAPLPPSPFQDSSVNVISAYSVFSHLSERAFLAWMNEFHRILQPDGILAFTTRNEGFMDYCGRLRNEVDSLSGYAKALAMMMPDIRGAKERYNAGEFVFVTDKGLGGGGAMNESFYGEAFIPKPYVKRTLGKMFELLDFKASGEAYDQALFVLKKRS